MRSALALLLALLVGCSGSAASVDAGTEPDAGEIALPGCDLPFEDVYVAATWQIRPPSEGRDLDGDGEIDNQLGVLAWQFNPEIQQNLEDGSSIAALVLPGLQLPAPTDPIDIDMSVPLLRDADVPPDPLNNIGGEGEFLLSPVTFDASCRPLSVVEAVQDGASISGHSDRFLVVFSSGLIEARDVYVTATVAADGARLNVLLEGVYTSCAWARIPLPGPDPGSALRGLVGLGLQPDIDLDGDGLESFVVDGDAIASCIDGDGAITPGPACACDPGFADGYSIAQSLEMVPGRIVGWAP